MIFFFISDSSVTDSRWCCLIFTLIGNRPFIQHFCSLCDTTFITCRYIYYKRIVTLDKNVCYSWFMSHVSQHLPKNFTVRVHLKMATHLPGLFPLLSFACPCSLFCLFSAYSSKMKSYINILQQNWILNYMYIKCACI